jgi:dolichol-phosphate mannosyltransferase
MHQKSIVTVVIPAYNADYKLAEVLALIPREVSYILVVDDGSTRQKVEEITSNVADPRLQILKHETNCGIGAAMKTGYRKAVTLESHVIVKIDADGQMDPSMIPNFINPILENRYDYTKGNRFVSRASLKGMPKHRLLGNLVLTGLSRISSGYWRVSDPTNGFTAISGDILKKLPIDNLEQRYFFESDLLYQLKLLDGRVQDIPMKSSYGDEKSQLSAIKSIFEFSYKHLRNLIKRIYKSFFN